MSPPDEELQQPAPEGDAGLTTYSSTDVGPSPLIGRWTWLQTFRLTGDPRVAHPTATSGPLQVLEPALERLTINGPQGAASREL